VLILRIGCVKKSLNCCRQVARNRILRLWIVLTAFIFWTGSRLKRIRITFLLSLTQRTCHWVRVKIDGLWLSGLNELPCNFVSWFEWFIFILRFERGGNCLRLGFERILLRILSPNYWVAAHVDRLQIDSRLREVIFHGNRKVSDRLAARWPAFCDIACGVVLLVLLRFLHRVWLQIKLVTLSIDQADLWLRLYLVSSA